MLAESIVGAAGVAYLVVPAEAAGAARRAAGGVAAAAAAAAMGASEVLNYWAGLEDDTAGEIIKRNSPQ